MANFPAIAPIYSPSKQSQSLGSIFRLGDGYEASINFGLNSFEQDWSLEWAVGESQAIEIDSFLQYCADNSQAFNWQPPGETAVYLWRCDEWNIEQQFVDLFRITAKFLRVHELSAPELDLAPGLYSNIFKRACPQTSLGSGLGIEECVPLFYDATGSFVPRANSNLTRTLIVRYRDNRNFIAQYQQIQSTFTLDETVIAAKTYISANQRQLITFRIYDVENYTGEVVIFDTADYGGSLITGWFVEEIYAPNTAAAVQDVILEVPLAKIRNIGGDGTNGCDPAELAIAENEGTSCVGGYAYGPPNPPGEGDGSNGDNGGSGGDDSVSVGSDGSLYPNYPGTNTLPYPDAGVFAGGMRIPTQDIIISVNTVAESYVWSCTTGINLQAASQDYTEVVAVLHDVVAISFYTSGYWEGKIENCPPNVVGAGINAVIAPGPFCGCIYMNSEGQIINLPLRTINLTGISSVVQPFPFGQGYRGYRGVGFFVVDVTGTVSGPLYVWDGSDNNNPHTQT